MKFPPCFKLIKFGFHTINPRFELRIAAGFLLSSFPEYYDFFKCRAIKSKNVFKHQIEQMTTNDEIIKIIDNIKQTISDCEDVMKLLNPTYAKDAERDQQQGISEVRTEAETDRYNRVSGDNNSYP